MKILFLNAYFYPENIAFSHLEQDIMEALLGRGHELRVICPTPSRGLSKSEIRRYKKIRQETVGGVAVRRFHAPAEGKNPLLRTVRYLWCSFREYQLGRRQTDVDAIFAVSTPPTQGRMAGRLAQKLGIPLVYSIQDLFPDSLVTSGLASESSLLYRMGRRMEEKTYRAVSKLIVLSDAVRELLLSRGVPAEKLTTVSNWIDTEQVAPVLKDDNPLYEEYGVDKNTFNIVYAGNFGASQGADIILRTAERLRDNAAISFVIFGGGSEFEKAQALQQELRLDNVRMFPLLPAERTAQVYSMGDLALITCKKGVGRTAVPSKLWSIMACNTPIVASFDTDSELAKILKESGAGVCVEPEDPAALAREIEKAFRKDRTKTTAREYVQRHASKEECVSRYVQCIENAR